MNKKKKHFYFNLSIEKQKRKLTPSRCLLELVCLESTLTLVNISQSEYDGFRLREKQHKPLRTTASIVMNMFLIRENM